MPIAGRGDLKLQWSVAGLVLRCHSPELHMPNADEPLVTDRQSLRSWLSGLQGSDCGFIRCRLCPLWLLRRASIARPARCVHPVRQAPDPDSSLSLIHISEPTRQAEISYAVFCLKKKK